jgi:hypothetical protein
MNEHAGEVDAAGALAAMDEARAALLERVAWGSWRYDLIYSALAAVMVMGQILPLPLDLVVDAVVVAGLVVLARWWRARTGVWISGATPTRARWVALAIGALAALGCVAVVIAARHGQGWIAFFVGPSIGLLALSGSRLWRRVHREEVQAGVVSTAGCGVVRWPLIGAGLACALLATGLALLGTEAYIVGVFVGMGAALIAAPWLMALKRRFMFR